MTNAGRNARTAVVTALMTLVAGPASAHDQPIAANPATIVLHVVNYAGIPRDVLDKTRLRVAGIYKAIGVRIVWVDSEQPIGTTQAAGLHLTVMMLSRARAEKKISAEKIPDSALGIAHLPSRRAYIFVDRIDAVPRQQVLAIGLGDVIAHEVGHLVLASTTHSLSGLMRANMDMREFQIQAFDSRQVRAIHAALMQTRFGATGN